ncbi:MAG: flavodoxin family protein [Candidatus Lokiarchaeota archaeon]|nr:flavodoxin family protein [Candidatus Lokiarchaeota archaeon]
MSKKITLIVGSPRKNRSCNYLIDCAIDGIKSVSEELEINKLQISDYSITPCNGCDQCLRPPNDCPLAENDDTKKLEETLLNSAALLIAAPNYFGSMSSQVKVLIDRSRPWKMKGYLLKDVIFAPLASTGLRGYGEGVISGLINFALIQGMIVVGNNLGSPVLEGNIPINSLQKFTLKEFMGKGEVDELAGTIARDVGKRVGELVLKIL